MKRANAAPRRQPGTALARGTPKPPKEEKTVENTAPRTMREADAVDLLTDDHLRVSALFKQFEKLAKKEAPAAERQSLAQAICAMLKVHTTIEEEIFYPAVRGAERRRGHGRRGDRRARLGQGPDRPDPGDGPGRRSVRRQGQGAVGSTVEHHVVEEEGEMFRSAVASAWIWWPCAPSSSRARWHCFPVTTSRPGPRASRDQ